MKHFFWEEPLFYKYCADGMIRRCIPEDAVQSIIFHCHYLEFGGYISTSKTIAKVSKFYWSAMYKDTIDFVKRCDKCQRTDNISSKDEMPLNVFFELELFDIWGIDFMGSFSSPYNKKYTLVVVDYVSKWIEVIATPTNNAKVVLKFIK